MRNANKYGLLQNIMQNKVDGTRVPSRRGISWLANRRKWCDIITSTELFGGAVNKVQSDDR